MAVRKFSAGMIMALLVGALSGSVDAALIAPAKGFVKINEPLVVRFLQEKGDEGKQTAAKLGPQAAELDNLYAADTSGEAKLYSLDGKAIAAAGSTKPGEDGTLDLLKIYPQIWEGGTFVLTYKDAQPLVVEVLFNPGMKSDFQNLSPEEKKKQLTAVSGPVVIHIVPLEYAEITTEKGVIKATFAYDVAPHTVDNFTSLAKQKFYDGTVFHRIIKGFMVQGGDATGDVEGRAGTGGPGYQVMHEFSDKPHDKGVLSMARSSELDSAGSQFFIMHGKSSHLDGQYSAFGQVIDGIKVVDDLAANTPVSDNNGTVSGKKPRIESIRIIPATADMYGIK